MHADSCATRFMQSDVRSEVGERRKTTGGNGMMHNKVDDDAHG